MKAKVNIDGEIVSRVSLETTYPYTTLQYVRDMLEWQKPFDSVRVIINSPGGSVGEGFAIYDYLRSLNVEVETEAVGQCSSIATAIFLAGKTRVIHEHCDFLIHLPSGGAQGTAEQMQDYVDEMVRQTQKLIDLYVDRAGVNGEEIAALMAEETKLTPEQVMSLGFATAIVQPMTALAKLSPTSSALKPAEQATNFMKDIKAMLVGFADTIKGFATGNAEIKALDVKTSAGSTLKVDTGDRTTYAEGDAVTNADGTAVTDGDVTLEDGTVLTVAGGKITKVTAAETNAKKDDDQIVALTTVVGELVTFVGTLSADFKAFKASSQTAQNDDVKALKTSVQEIKASVASVAGSMSTGGKVGAKAGEENEGATDAAEAAAATRAAKRQPRSERLYI